MIELIPPNSSSMNGITSPTWAKYFYIFIHTYFNGLILLHWYDDQVTWTWTNCLLHLRAILMKVSHAMSCKKEYVLVLIISEHFRTRFPLLILKLSPELLHVFRAWTQRVCSQLSWGTSSGLWGTSGTAPRCTWCSTRWLPAGKLNILWGIKRNHKIVWRKTKDDVHDVRRNDCLQGRQTF